MGDFVRVVVSLLILLRQRFPRERGDPVRGHVFVRDCRFETRGDEALDRCEEFFRMGVRLVIPRAFGG